MNIGRAIASAAAGAAMIAGFATSASAGTVWAQNNSKNAIWISVYLYNGHNGGQGAFCVLPGETKSRSNSTIGNVGSGVIMRAEVKRSGTSCANHSNIFDFDTKLQTAYANNRAMVVFTSSRPGDRPTATTGWK